MMDLWEQRMGYLPLRLSPNSHFYCPERIFAPSFQQDHSKLPYGETMPNWKMLKATWGLRTFAMTKIPLIAILRPTLLAMDKNQCVVSIPFAWLAKNHLRSMYFGALCIGADAAGGEKVAAALAHVAIGPTPRCATRVTRAPNRGR